MHLSFYETLTQWLRDGKRVAVVTLVETVGSTPRKPGAKMLVSDRLELHGTVGGGCVEADVIFAAQEAIRQRRPRLIRVDIKAKNAHEIDMLCGGEALFYVEPVMTTFNVLICGGGHIGRALAAACAPLDFAISVVDDRPQFASTDRFPAAKIICCPYEELAANFTADENTLAVVVTRGHSGDEACLRALLSSRAAYIGMVGSRAKWAALRDRLRIAGFSEDQLKRVVTPAGLDIGSVTPEEIAISIAAQLVQHRARLTGPPPAKPTDE
ncbi:XdhC/CoxI family protein [soil metagenome]